MIILIYIRHFNILLTRGR